MKKAFWLINFIFLTCIAYGQTNFEGVIDYSSYFKNKSTNDSTSGPRLRLMFSKNAIKVQRITQTGTLWEEHIIIPDSGFEFVIDHRFNVYYKIELIKLSNSLSRFPPGINAIKDMHLKKNISGYDVNIIGLYNNKESNFYTELGETKKIAFAPPPDQPLFRLLPQIGDYILFDNHIQLAIKIFIPGFTTEYYATKVDVGQIDPSEFKVPKGLTYTTLHQLGEDINSGKLRSQ